jgi:(E)-4-hydroxy-3-methylbut-2-enyl-diphosphate synthase
MISVGILDTKGLGHNPSLEFLLPKGERERLEKINKDITVAIMGCVVNGPGEAKEADIGVAGGDGCGIIFKKGEILRKVPEDSLLTELMAEIEKL